MNIVVDWGPKNNLLKNIVDNSACKDLISDRFRLMKVETIQKGVKNSKTYFYSY